MTFRGIDSSFGVRNADKRLERLSRSVFINCPYSSSYRPMFDTIVFCLLDFGFIPRSAMEIDTGTSSRFEKICNIIQECKFGIHDISKVSTDEQTGLPHFNMPFELGLFLGASKFDSDVAMLRDCLILGGRAGDQHLSISDLSGHDISFHEHDHEKTISAIRRFLVQRAPQTLPGAKHVLQRRALFESRLPEMLKRRHLDPSEVTYLDFCKIAEAFLLALELRQGEGLTTVELH